MSTSKKGIECVAYVNTNTYDTPTWVAADCIRDFKQGLSSNTQDAGTRKSRINKKVPTTKDLSWTGSFQEDGSTAAAQLYDSFINDTPVDMLILDGPNNEDGTKGIRSTCIVTKFDTDQGREALLYPEIEIFPTEDPGNHEPMLVAVSGGVPVYTAF